MRLSNKRFGFLIILGLWFGATTGQSTIPASQIVDKLKTVGNVQSVLYIAAHPDDENTRLISYLTKHEHADVSYLSLTRGDGGQNLIGTEIGDQLGLLRTQELLAARRIDGGNQYFTRAIDFGYSKTPEETFKFWNKDAVLSDVVWVIRNVRPDVIITRFSPDINPDRPTHGHHTASAMLAVEAFKAAADPTQFVEQLKYVDTWQPKSIFWNTSYWFYGSVERMDEEVAKSPGDYVKIDVNKYLPLLGQSGSDISSHSRSQHKSQGFGNAPVIGNQWEYLQVLEGGISEHLFKATYKQKALSTKLDKRIAKVIKAFDMHHPEHSISGLYGVRDLIAQIEDDVLRKRKLDQIHKIILQCAGVKATAYCKEQTVHVGQDIETKLDIVSTQMFRVVSMTKSWNGVGFASTEQQPYFTKQIQWSIPKHASSQPYWLTGTKSVGSYGVKDQQLIGQAVQVYPFVLTIRLEIEGDIVVMEVPMLHASTDPVKGQVIQPIVVTPNVMLNMERKVYVFASEKPKMISVDVISGKPNESGYVEMVVPKGWKCEPAFIKTSFKGSGERKQFQFKVTPPTGESNARIRAIFKDEALVYSMGIYQLNYDHVAQVALFPSAESSVVKVDLKTTGNHIAYVMGAGDKVPESITEMGYQVTLLSVDDVAKDELEIYDAIVFGVRALNTIEAIETINTKITAYVKGGGNLVMQYNTAHRLKSQPLGPYKIKLSRDRVTDEEAGVKLLKPEHKVLNTPNKITSIDFNGWVQERGLYFPAEWDSEMSAILSMHDQGEEPKLGSLLIGAYGEGYVVYTGLSFFRELPAGVPGAYRLLANILSL
ncbi:MAG: LmbE family N-acetylglucosaminyl deacetylase [Bacteroidia bacterium]|jgi:LmbE family N-acetylglucosaminyl deacetylase